MRTFYPTPALKGHGHSCHAYAATILSDILVLGSWPCRLIFFPCTSSSANIPLGFTRESAHSLHITSKRNERGAKTRSSKVGSDFCGTRVLLDRSHRVVCFAFPILREGLVLIPPHFFDRSGSRLFERDLRLWAKHEKSVKSTMLIFSFSSTDAESQRTQI